MKAHVNWKNVAIVSVITLVLMPIAAYAVTTVVGLIATPVILVVAFIVGFVAASIFKPIEYDFE